MKITRRIMLKSAAAVATTTALDTLAPSSAFAAPDPIEQAQLLQFSALSAALTGIDKNKLAPGVDPINVRQTLFERVKKEQPPVFAQLIRVFDQNKDKKNVADIILNQSGDDIRFLARSIMLAWYLGAWYDPADLKNPPGFLDYRIISAPAYTQGWVWRAAQTHPMGYSELLFGYWSNPPPKLSEPSVFKDKEH